MSEISNKSDLRNQKDVKQEPQSIEYNDNIDFLEPSMNVKVEIKQEFEDWCDQSSLTESGANSLSIDLKIEIEDTVVRNSIKSEMPSCEEGNITNSRKAQDDSKTRTKPLKYICEQCGYATNLKTTYENHLTIHSDHRPYTCHKCGKSFKRKDAIIDHLNRHDVDKPKKYLCEKCTYRTNFWSSFDRHLTTHTTERPCVCVQCGKGYKHKTSLALHLKMHSDDGSQMKKTVRRSNMLGGMHTCDICGYKTHYKCDFKKHVKLHSDDRPFVCGNCGRGFKRKHYLTEHIKRLACFRRRTTPQNLKSGAVAIKKDPGDCEQHSETIGTGASTLIYDIKNEVDVKTDIFILNNIKKEMSDVNNNDNNWLVKQ